MFRERFYFVIPAACISALLGVAAASSLKLWIIFGCCIFIGAGSLLAVHFFSFRLVIVLSAVSLLSTMAWTLHMTALLSVSSERVTQARVIQVDRSGEDKQVFTVQAERSRVRVTAPATPKVAIGDTVRFSCKAEIPESTTFAFQQYLWSHNISLVCYVFSIDRVIHSSSFSSAFFRDSQDIQETIASTLQEPASSFVLSMVFGNDALIDEHAEEIFRATGLTHVLVVSGMQVLLLLGIVEWILVRLGLERRARLCIHVAISIGYVLIVGGDPSVVRAACIVALAFYLRLSGRLRGNALRMLLYVATIMVIFRPYSLLYDIGFELSFLAALGLLVVAPRLKKYMDRLPYAALWSDAVALSCSAALVTSPLIALRFHTFSLIGIVANIALGGVFGLFTILSFFWSALMLCSIDVAVFFSPPLRMLAVCAQKAVEFFASIPYASIQWSL